MVLVWFDSLILSALSSKPSVCGVVQSKTKQQLLSSISAGSWLYSGTNPVQRKVRGCILKLQESHELNTESSEGNCHLVFRVYTIQMEASEQSLKLMLWPPGGADQVRNPLLPLTNGMSSYHDIKRISSHCSGTCWGRCSGSRSCQHAPFWSAGAQGEMTET